MGLLGSYFGIKRGEAELRELQRASSEAYAGQSAAEEQLIALEKPEVQEWLRSEFAFDRAMNLMADRYADKGIHINPQIRKTEDTVKFARLMAKATKKAE